MLMFSGIHLKVRDHIPLEQGLRLTRSCSKDDRRSQRPYSIRTRIKTLDISVFLFHLSVRDHIPLEQGLRHYL